LTVPRQGAIVKESRWSNLKAAFGSDSMFVRVLVMWGILAAAPPALAQAPREGAENAALGEWPLETLRTKAGAEHRGLVQSEGPREVEFVEVFRSPGKDMMLIIRPIPAAAVASIERLPDDQRKQLAQRIEAFRQRAQIEAGAVESVQLAESSDGDRVWLYDGPWFRLVGAGEEETTRRAVVRIEQMFRAYRNAFPPRRQPQNRLRVYLFGSTEQYRSDLREKGLEVSHPALFSAPTNTILAGADLTHYAERLNRIRAENQRIRDDFEVRNRDFAARKRELAEQLKTNGFTDEEVAAELAVRQKAWQDQFDAMMLKLKEVDRRNNRAFDAVSDQLFARLKHEAFHAYVENYLYPHDEYAFPRWLNEGLAQIFETARLEDDTLRIDAPDRERRLQLQADLAGSPLPLAELLRADDNEFLVTHERAGTSERPYLYSWGLAWRLLVNGELSRRGALDRYIEERSAATPIEGFEQLVGMKLPEYERQWREAMTTLGKAP
jgi:hypothetical protein